MLVDVLALVVVFGIELAVGAGDGLRRFVGFEAQVASLMLFSHLFVTETVVAKHKVVVRLQVLGIDGEHLLQDFHGVGVLPLQKQNAAKIIQRHSIMRILRKHNLEMRRSLIVVSGGFHQRSVEEIGSRQLRVECQRFLKNGAGAREIAFLQGGASDV